MISQVKYLEPNEVDAATAGQVAASWWDANADEYLAEHGDFLGSAEFRWGPEGVTEAELGLLGDVSGLRILEIGAGAAQCSRWLASQGAVVTATDISARMLSQARLLNERTGCQIELVQCDARSLPFAAESFDAAFTSFGALQFVPDPVSVFREVARVLRVGGRWVFSVTHPFRWMFPDDPTLAGLTAIRSYFSRSPYAELNDAGQVEYAEYHHTIGDYVRALDAAGLQLRDLIEPEWPEANQDTWGGWGPERGKYLPGTAIFVSRKR